MRAIVIGVLWGFALPAAAMAQPTGPRIHAGEGIGSIISEIRGGPIWHDPTAKESSAALNGELLFVSPVPARLTAGLDSVYRWMLEPRVHLGFTANLEGKTSKGYAGLTWTTMLARDVFRPGDGIRFDVLFGGSVNDGKHDARLPDRKDLGGNLLFHVGAELGYQVNRQVSVSFFVDHDSNGGTARRNQGLNSLGLRLGYAL
ncbi:acyloxyacyl hydrolase [Dankookia rubra]|uniref:Acyloxyacyl hydrolase n=1 Tax=Dankookia rubra TaxID=1442381 RepID=A0A4V3AA12_9PROT|nr:acyloxyacyl hydrolase [Dankookia rubra]TDH61325.1 acyloxyacyl hydrolase [Dankookia rubra]